MTSVSWERSDESAGHSVARRDATATGWSYHGVEVLAGAEGWACWFRVDLDGGHLTRQVELHAFGATRERVVRLRADDDRRWSVDGEARPDLDGCTDVDVAATPLTNTFPISRLGRLGVGDAVTIAAAWVDVPSLTVTRVDQTYRRLPAVDGRPAWQYSDATYGAFRLTVDEDGLVIDYEGLARRVPRLDPSA